MEDKRPDARMDVALTEAAQWWITLSDSIDHSSHDHEFRKWAEARPENPKAFEMVRKAWNKAGKVGAHPIDSGSIGGAVSSLPDIWQKRMTSQTRRFAIAAVVMFLAVGLITLFSKPNLFTEPNATIYATSIGERRTVNLEDGSVLMIDSNSSVRVNYSEHERNLELEKGQAKFNVAHDTTRPFKVKVQNETIIATGTSFNIEILKDKAVVTLIEGRVVVKGIDRPQGIASMISSTADQRKFILEAGHRLVISRNTADFRLSSVNTESTQSWEQGQMIVDNEPLSEVLDRLNRYLKYPILLESERAGQFRISGIFDTNDEMAFVNALTATAPIVVIYDDRKRIVLRAL